jgi:hypothetical protein
MKRRGEPGAYIIKVYKGRDDMGARFAIGTEGCMLTVCSGW